MKRVRRFLNKNLNYNEGEMKRNGEILERSSTYSFIRFNDKIKLHELVGCECITKSEIGAGWVKYIDKQVVIHTG